MSSCLSCRYCIKSFNEEVSPIADEQMVRADDYYMDCKFNYYKKFTTKTHTECKRFRRI